jgi:hypothetical protein
MSHLRTTIGRRFQPEDPDYNPDDSAMAEIHCRVKVRIPVILSNGSGHRDQ